MNTQILILTQGDQTHYRTAGCEPTCHACLVPIGVGQEYAHHQVAWIPRGTLIETLMAMYCRACHEANAPIHPTQRTRTDAIVARMHASAVLAPRIGEAPGAGCFTVGGKIVG